MIVRCHACQKDPAGHFKQPPALIFVDPYAEGGARYACREHVPPRKEEELQQHEQARGYKLR